jgi:hypothetical protein
MGEPKRQIASTRYSRTIKAECVQMCGWQPGENLTLAAVRHFYETGHETAVIYSESVHYHGRSDEALARQDEREPR